MKKIIFYGGTGQCKVMREIADSIGKLVAVLDDTAELLSPFEDVPFYCGKDCFKEWKNSNKENDYYFAITIGNPHAQRRRKLADELISQGLRPIQLIHDSAIVDPTASLGEGVQVHAGSIINAYAKIGNYCILNTRSLIEHDCYLSDGVEAGPGSILCGEVMVGENSWIGAGSVIRQRIAVGNNSIVGAGAVVVKDVQNKAIVAGVPAKLLDLKLEDAN